MMKKEYTKPMAIVEDFSLQTSIAAGCKETAPLPTEGQCGYPIPGIGNVFVSGVAGCTYTAQDGAYNSPCYHVPSQDNILFNS